VVLFVGIRVGPIGHSIEDQEPKKGYNYMASVDVDIKKLLEAGVHFGHKTSRWHPKMAPYIHSKRNGSHIIDLTKTVEGLDKALDFIADTASQGKQVLFVATKRQAQNIVKEAAESVNMPYVTERWLGGMLTNWNTIGAQIKVLKDLEAKMDSGELANKYSKLEVQRYQEEIDQMNEIYGGIKNMAARPGAIFVVDVNHDANAVLIRILIQATSTIQFLRTMMRLKVYSLLPIT
jgi:small subunit ribosomal protein S2